MLLLLGHVYVFILHAYILNMSLYFTYLYRFYTFKSGIGQEGDFITQIARIYACETFKNEFMVF